MLCFNYLPLSLDTEYLVCFYTALVFNSFIAMPPRRLTYTAWIPMVNLHLPSHLLPPVYQTFSIKKMGISSQKRFNIRSRARGLRTAKGSTSSQEVGTHRTHHQCPQRPPRWISHIRQSTCLLLLPKEHKHVFCFCSTFQIPWMCPWLVDSISNPASKDSGKL